MYVRALYKYDSTEHGQKNKRGLTIHYQIMWNYKQRKEKEKKINYVNSNQKTMKHRKKNDDQKKEKKNLY